MSGRRTRRKLVMFWQSQLVKRKEGGGRGSEIIKIQAASLVAKHAYFWSVLCIQFLFFHMFF